MDSFLTLKQADAIDLLVKHHADINILTTGNYDPKHKNPGPSQVKAPNGRLNRTGIGGDTFSDTTSAYGRP